jgi:hypothetical protein
MKPTASVKTLSARFDIKPRTIRQWMVERKFTWYKPAKIVLIDVESFERFLSKNTIEPVRLELSKKGTIHSPMV